MQTNGQPAAPAGQPTAQTQTPAQQTPPAQTPPAAGQATVITPEQYAALEAKYQEGQRFIGRQAQEIGELRAKVGTPAAQPQTPPDASGQPAVPGHQQPAQPPAPPTPTEQQAIDSAWQKLDADSRAELIKAMPGNTHAEKVGAVRLEFLKTFREQAVVVPDSLFSAPEQPAANPVQVKRTEEVRSVILKAFYGADAARHSATPRSAANPSPMQPVFPGQRPPAPQQTLRSGSGGVSDLLKSAGRSG